MPGTRERSVLAPAQPPPPLPPFDSTSLSLACVLVGRAIREAMVKIMTASYASQPSPGDNEIEKPSLYATKDTEDSQPLPLSQGEEMDVRDPAPPVDTSTCAFWSAIALGGLVRGRPVETVSLRGWLCLPISVLQPT